MKPTMLFAIVALTAVVMASSFDLQLLPNPPLKVKPELLDSVLYLCPVTSAGWDSAAKTVGLFRRPIVFFFFSVCMILFFSWGWALYQNLLKDEFKRDSFKNPWAMTKIAFWAGVIVLLVLMTPNHFRKVRYGARPEPYVLCESDTPGAHAGLAEKVSRW